MTKPFLGRWSAPNVVTWLFSILVLPFLVATAIKGDTIELKTGERIDGVFKQATTAGAVIEVAGQSISIPLDKVQAIYFGAVPIRTIAGPPPSQEALDALKALRSVTGSGIAYRDYSQRVLDAKVKVDRYLSSPANDPAAVRSAIGLAMSEYELASQGWSTAFSTSTGTLTVATNVGTTLYGDPEISKCPAIRQFLFQTDQTAERSRLARNKSLVGLISPDKGNKPTDFGLIGLLAGERPALLWTCASAQVAQAEQLLAVPMSPSSSSSTVPAIANPTLEQVVAHTGEDPEAAAITLASMGQPLPTQAQLIQKGRASRCAVVTAPPGAEVEVDGKRAGVSPLGFVLLKQGDTPRRVTIRMNGYKTVERAVVPDGKPIPIGLALEK